MIRTCILADEAATLALGRGLARALSAEIGVVSMTSSSAFGSQRTLQQHLDALATVYLRGDLGAGKTTLARGLLRALGHAGSVKSPTYTLVESYDFKHVTVHHLDLYRLVEPSELEALGIRDMLDPTSLVLVEWPERGVGWLPAADIEVQLSHLAQGRGVCIRAYSPRGRSVVQMLGSTGII